MPTTENCITIKGKIQDIYNCILGLEKWPTFIPSIKYSKIIGTFEGKELHEMSTTIFGIKSKWKSYLVLAYPFNNIRYQQLEGFCTRMGGEWILKNQNDYIHVTLLHDFAFNVPIIGFIFEPIIRKYVMKISDHILGGIKSYIEGKLT